MKVIIHKVERNSFEKEGKVIRYCKFNVLKGIESTSDLIGSESISYTTNYDNYEKIVNLYKMNKPVEITLAYKQIMTSGLYKEYVSKIDDIEL